jgi:hypothetical protein
MRSIALVSVGGTIAANGDHLRKTLTIRYP